MNTMLAFHNDPAIKEKYLARIAAHRKADELIHGVGWEDGKGCAIGCTLEAYDHARYETELGIPQMLARLEDRIFEGLANDESQKWPERFLKAIRPGADLSLVGWKFLLWLFEDTQKRYATPGVRKACKPVGVILKAKAKGKRVSESAAEHAAYAAKSAAKSAESAAIPAQYAIYAAVYASRSAEYAAYAAVSVAGSAAVYASKSAEYAAYAEYAESAKYAVWSTSWLRMADKLIELLETA